MLFQELVVFEDLNVFHSQEECVSLDPIQEPTSEKEEDSVGKMMLMGKKSRSLCVQIECCGKMMFFYFISDFSKTPFTPVKYMLIHMFNFYFIPCARACFNYGWPFSLYLGGSED